MVTYPLRFIETGERRTAFHALEKAF